MSTPYFLRALDLGDDADERAVRRAYAQRLKRIDPGTDPEAFQALRGHYENALRWVQGQRERAHDEVDDAPPVEAVHRESPEAAPQDAPPVELDEDARMRARGEEVFAGFAQRMAQGFTDEGSAKHALEAALHDDRLINLEARTFFEWRVASLLMQGWKPGHELLFGPAAAVFTWEQDRRRLALFGSLGAALDAAITEKLIFFRQPPAQFEMQRRLIRRLRDAAQPPSSTLRNDMPLLQMLVQRYPHWLRLVTSRANIEQWYQWHDALPAGPAPAAEPVPAAARPAPSRYESKEPGLPWWPFAILIFIAIKVLGSLGQSAEDRAFHPPPPPSTDWRAPGEPRRSLILTPPEVAPVFTATAPASVPAASAPSLKLVDLQKRQRQAELELRKAIDAAKAVHLAPAQASPTTAVPPPPAPAAPVWLATPEPQAPAGAPPPAAPAPTRLAPRASPYSLTSGAKAVEDAVPAPVSSWSQRSTYDLAPGPAASRPMP